MKSWLRRFRDFTSEVKKRRIGDGYARIKRPVAKSTLNRLSHQLRLPVPLPLLEFFSNASSQCLVGYYIEWDNGEICGQMDLPSVRHAKSGLRNCKEWGEGMDDADASHAWLNAFPFLDLGNGDVIAMDLSAGLSEMPVVYLNHEGSYIPPLADSLKEFLYHWERICYRGPSYWDIREFIDKRSGKLNSDLKAAQQFRKFMSTDVGLTRVAH